MRIISSFAAVCLLFGSTAMAAPVKYVLPEETAALATGPNSDIAQATCSACHSVDYITTQPTPQKDAKGFWTAEVTKMQKVFGAPVDPDNAPKIVDYLAATYTAK